MISPWWLSKLLKRHHFVNSYAAHLKIAELNENMEQKMEGLSAEIRKSKTISDSMSESIFFATQKKYFEAMRAYQNALDIDPDLEGAKIGTAVAKSYLTPEDLSESIRLLDEVIERNSKNSRAFYNRACLKALVPQEWQKREWLIDLKRQ